MSDPFTALTKVGFGAWSRTPLKGDASSRQFLRLTNESGETAIAMHTPDSLAPSQAIFKQIAEHLRAHGISAPRILAQDSGTGLMILEDLGRTDLATCLDQNPTNETEFYNAAIDVITTLRDASVPTSLTKLTADVAVEMLGPLYEFYTPNITSVQQQELAHTFHPILSSALDTQHALALRDYHAENLIWRADKTGLDRIGVLDFQDALSAPPEYDLASLLRDARRDVSAQTHSNSIACFAQSTNQDFAKVAERCAILAVQRNLRILGIFARLAKKDGKPSYLHLIPRVENYIRSDLQHPSLAPLQPLITPMLNGGTA